MGEAINNSTFFVVMGVFANVFGIITFIFRKDLQDLLRRKTVITNPANDQSVADRKNIKKTSSTTVLIVGIVLCLLGVGLIVFSFSSTPSNNPDMAETLSEKANRLLLGGDHIIYKEAAYYINNENCLCKLSIDNEKHVAIRENSENVACVIDGWIYFNNTDNCFYRIRTDGQDEMKLYDHFVVSVAYLDDVLYYLSKPNDAQDQMFLYSMRIDGTEIKSICDIPMSEYVISKGWIYFVDKDGYINKMQLDGSRLDLLDNATVAKNICVVDNMVYFIQPNFNSGLYKMSIFGDGKEPLIKMDTVASVRSFIVDSENIYFTTFLSKYKGLSSINLKSGELTTLWTEGVLEITHMENGWIYVKSLESCYKIFPDGKSKPIELFHLHWRTGLTSLPHK